MLIQTNSVGCQQKDKTFYKNFGQGKTIANPDTEGVGTWPRFTTCNRALFCVGKFFQCGRPRVGKKNRLHQQVATEVIHLLPKTASRPRRSRLRRGSAVFGISNLGQALRIFCPSERKAASAGPSSGELRRKIAGKWVCEYRPQTNDLLKY